ncbi:MAG: lytic transglycosylase domain-containing protein [Thermodesulfobacteriota bacterium]
MEINFNYKNIFTKIIYIALFINIFVINSIKAEPFIRVYKNGVIFYYFNNKSDKYIYYKDNIDRPKRSNGLQPHNNLSAQELEPWIKWASQHHNLPSALIKAVIRVESNFNPSATSPKGAQGLMQLMPGTAQQLQVDNAYDIRENIFAGTRYLGMLLQKFNNNLPLALAAYNAGPKKVERFQGIPPIQETHGFVRNVCANFLRYSGESPSPH